MSRSFLLTPELQGYLAAHSEPDDRAIAALAAETERLGDVARMSTAPEVARLLTLLARLLGVRNAIEVGTFTGLSALCVARGLAEGGRLLCCDVSEEWTAIARRHWERAGVSDRIELRLGPAAETLAALPSEPAYDFAFIDADKPSYAAYVDLLYPRLRTNAVIAVDNVLWGGRVLDESDSSENTAALRAFNSAVARDARWETVMLSIGDGLTLIRKR